MQYAVTIAESMGYTLVPKENPNEGSDLSVAFQHLGDPIGY